MTDVFKVADLLVSHALEAHREDIDIIGYYGSYAQGTAAAGSDLDIFYIPADGKTPPAGHTFLLDGRLFDFWAISWETMEGFATGQVRGWAFAPALVHHAKVLHARSEAQASRLAALKQRVLDLQKPAARPQMIRRALQAFRNVTLHAGNVHLGATDGSFTDVRHAGWSLVKAALECLALVNQTFFDRGLRRCIDQLAKLKHRPADLQQLILRVGSSQDTQEIVSACDQLALGTRQVLHESQESLAATIGVAKRFRQYYPEFKDMIGKLLRACDTQDAVAVSIAAWSVQIDLSLALDDTVHGAGHAEYNLYGEVASAYRAMDLPDLMQTPPGQTGTMRDQAALLDERLRQWLQKESVSLEEYEDLKHLERSLRQ